MKRQIKFRGKSADGKWHYGDLRQFGRQDKDLTGKVGIFPVNDDDWRGCPIVDPDTISQFANVTDCNDKEIYEGDILRNEVYDWNNEKLGYGYYEVYWEDAENGFHISPINEIAEAEEIRKWHWLNDMEIVGNRFDNPELLKVE